MKTGAPAKCGDGRLPRADSEGTDTQAMNMARDKLDRLGFALLKGYSRVGRRFPLRLWLQLGRGLGLLAYRLDRQHRRIVLQNLRLAYGPAMAARELRSLARRNFMQFGMLAQEFARLMAWRRIGVGDLRRTVKVEGLEHLRAARAQGGAVILLGAHFGNWEYAHLFYASHVNRLNFIVRRIDNPYLEAERVACNARFGVNILYKESGLRTAIQRLKAGEDLVIFSDQKANLKEGIACRFFGHRTATISIAPALARKYQVPLVPVCSVRDRDRVSHRLIFGPALEIDPRPGPEALKANTQRQNDAIEAMIRRHPDHWLWLHRKWKTEYPELYR